MAVKSGRISLLLHFVLMVLSLHESNHEIDIDTDCIQDIIGFIQAMESNRQSYLKEEEEEVKQPINTKSNNNKNSKLPFHKSSTALSSTSPPPLRSSSASSPEALHDDILTVQEDPLSSIKSTSSSTTAAVDFVDHIHARNGRFSRANPGIMKSNGILLSFGKADHGKLGHGDVQIHRLVPTVVESLQDVDIVKMSSMSTYAIAVDSCGHVYVWGTGGSAGGSHSARTDIQPQLLEALPPKAKVIDVSCGLGHALFLLSTNKVYSWGN